MSKQTYASSLAEGGRLGVVNSRGSGLGNYSIVGVVNSFVSVDPANLNAGQNVFVPRGFVAIVSAGGSVSSATAAAQVAVGIGVDGVCKTEQDITPNGILSFSSFGLSYVFAGDGAVHNFTLMANTSVAADACTILNDSALHAPYLMVEITQSSFTGVATEGSSQAEGNVGLMNQFAGKLGAVQNVGSGAGNYSLAFLAFQPVDGGGGQLTQSFFVPFGYSLIVSAQGTCGVGTAVPAGGIAVGLLIDGVLKVEQDVIHAAASQLNAFGLTWVVPGDGKFHTVSISAHTTVAADPVLIGNSSATHAPIIMGELTQNNMNATGGVNAPNAQSYQSSVAEGGRLGVIFLTGGGLGNYASNSTSFINVDSSLLSVTVMMPKGYVALITADGVVGASSAAAQIVETAIAVDGAVQQGSQTKTTATANTLIGFSNQHLFVGDDQAHTFSLMYHGAVGGGNVVMGNSSATHVPQLMVEITPSNVN